MSHEDNECQTFLHGTPAGHTEVYSREPSLRISEGVTRLTISRTAPLEAMQSTPQDASRVYGNATKYVHSISGDMGGDIMATLQTGAKASICLVAGDESTRTTLAVAERMGAIRREGDRWVAVQQAGTSAPSAQQPANSGEQHEPIEALFTPEDAADWAADIAPVPQAAFDNSLARVTDAVSTGTFDVQRIADKLAQEGGMTPELAADYVTKGTSLYQRTADDALARQGLQGDELQEAYAFMRESKPQALKHAIQAFTLQGDLWPLKKLASLFQAEKARQVASR